VVAGVAAMVMDLIWSAKKHFSSYNCQTLRANRGMLAVLEYVIHRKEQTECLMPWRLLNAKDWNSYSKAEDEGEKQGEKPDSLGGFFVLRGTLKISTRKGNLVD
jgi:hypothetical protein